MDQAIPQRPAIMFNRWQENWSVLADPRVKREPFDSLKYIPLSSTDPNSYLSFGANVRERFETKQNFIGPNREDAYDISRTEFHADLRIASQVQVFAQIQSDFAPGKKIITPVDQNRLDLEQGFIAVTEPIADGTLTLRIGRQEIAFDLQRFISVRDGPNVRQSYDAAWAHYEVDRWKFTGFFSHPVQTRDLRAFDDYSSDKLTYGGVRIERQLADSSSIAFHYARFTQANARFANASGNERRDILDVHLSGSSGPFDWDAEAMGQEGTIGTKDVKAWAVGSMAGYTLQNIAWNPRLGIQIDAASGDSHPGDNRLETFNPLFPNGYYVTLAGYTGFVNFIHVKPSITLRPAKSVKLMFAVASLWRETTGDAVYMQPDIPVPNTAGRAGRYTGTYGQVRMDWAINRAWSFAVEAVHFEVGDAIKRAGGKDSNYAGVQIAYGW